MRGCDTHEVRADEDREGAWVQPGWTVRSMPEPVGERRETPCNGSDPACIGSSLDAGPTVWGHNA